MKEESKQGLDKARYIYQDRTRRAKELKADGRNVVGYLCIYPVLEIITAAGLVPYRILGNMDEPITKADTCLPTIVCPFLRSTMDLGLKGKYDFLDGVVMCHGCEVGEKLSHIWRTYLSSPYFHFIDVPHTVHKAAQEQFKEQLKDFKGTLESYTGKEIDQDSLIDAANAYNTQRALVRELYDLRKPDPPLISGTETLQIMVALMSIPVEEGNDLLREVIGEVQKRKDGPQKKQARLLIWGSIIDDMALIDMIEQLDANVVMDDTCVGSRAYWPDVNISGDILEGLAYRYLVEIMCPRTFRGDEPGKDKKDYMADLATRYGYLHEYIKEWKVDGVILQSVTYCDIHGYEVPGLRDYLDSLSVPNIYLEHDYNKAALAPLKTRVQAFIEMLL